MSVGRWSPEVIPCYGTDFIRGSKSRGEPWRAPQVLAGAAVLLAGCGQSRAQPAEAVDLPPEGASHEVVLDTYLSALLAEDCDTARALATDGFTVGNGELCGAVEVSAFEPPSGPATPSEVEVVYSTMLTISGDTDGSLEPGRVTWLYTLRRDDGEWRLAGGGTSP